MNSNKRKQVDTLKLKGTESGYSGPENIIASAHMILDIQIKVFHTNCSRT